MKKSSAFARNLLTAGLGPIDTAIVKATFEDDFPPKEKHVQTLLNSIDEHNECVFVVPLFRRLGYKSFRIVFKTLLVIHRLCRDAAIIAMTRMQSRARFIANLTNFHDHDSASYSSLTRSYAAYLTQKFAVYNLTKFSPERVTPAEAKEWATNLPAQQAVTALPLLQDQLYKLTSIVATYPLKPLDEYLHAFLLRDGLRLYSVCSVLMLSSLNFLDEMDVSLTGTLFKCCSRVDDINAAFTRWFEALRKCRVTSESVPKFTELPPSFIKALRNRLDVLQGNVPEETKQIEEFEFDDDPFVDNSATTSASTSAAPAAPAAAASPAKPAATQRTGYKADTVAAAANRDNESAELHSFLNNTPVVASTIPQHDMDDPFFMLAANTNNRASIGGNTPNNNNFNNNYNNNFSSPAQNNAMQMQNTPMQMQMNNMQMQTNNFGYPTITPGRQSIASAPAPMVSAPASMVSAPAAVAPHHTTNGRGSVAGRGSVVGAGTIDAFALFNDSSLDPFGEETPVPAGVMATTANAQGNNANANANADPFADMSSMANTLPNNNNYNNDPFAAFADPTNAPNTTTTVKPVYNPTALNPSDDPFASLGIGLDASNTTVPQQPAGRKDTFSELASRGNGVAPAAKGFTNAPAPANGGANHALVLYDANPQAMFQQYMDPYHQPHQRSFLHAPPPMNPYLNAGMGGMDMSYGNMGQAGMGMQRMSMQNNMGMGMNMGMMPNNMGMGMNMGMNMGNGYPNNMQQQMFPQYQQQQYQQQQQQQPFGYNNNNGNNNNNNASFDLPF